MHAKSRCCAVVGAALFVSLCGLRAQRVAADIPTELRSRFGFDGPVITKIGEGIHTLRIADLDGNGQLEAVVCDPRRARLAVLHCAPTGTTLEPVALPGQISGYAIADTTGDGRGELLVVDSRGRLQVRVGGESTAPIDLGLGARGLTLLTGDLDNDGKADLMACARGALRWVTQLHAAPQLSAIESIEDTAYAFEQLDFDGDGKLDLSCIVPGPGMNLRLRRGKGNGQFGPWQIHHVEWLRNAWPLQGTSPARLATIEGQHRRAALRAYSPSGGFGALDWWAFESDNPRTPPYACGDIDGDGDDDVLLAQPGKALLLLYQWENGAFSVRCLPSLAGVTSLALGDVNQDGTLDVVLASPEEEVVAWRSGKAEPQAFPEPLRCLDRPVAVAVDARGAVIALTRNDKRNAQLVQLAPGQEPRPLADLGRLQADPAGLHLADVGDAAGMEACFVVPNEGLRTVNLLAPSSNNDKAGTTAGFAKKLDEGAFSIVDFQGKPTMVAVRERFVRYFRIDGSGQLCVLQQDNGPAGLDELSLSVSLPSGGRIYLDKKANKLVRALPDAPPTSLDVPAFDFTAMRWHGNAALLLGPRGLLRVPFADSPEMRPLALCEPPTDRAAFAQGRSGDFDGDGKLDLVVLDGSLPGFHILAQTERGLERAVSAPVFEAGPSESPDNEPRELATGDLNGDGRCDLVLLAHDRILIYLQQS